VNTVEKLKEKLQKALEAEHYEEAARLRDELKRLQSGN
jgi:protein-arginine kinase activator protein McsA